MVFIAPVRYGRMNQTENFLARFEGLRVDDEVIVRTSRGVEIGLVSGPVDEQERDDIRGLGEILRKVSEDDYKIAEHIHSVKEPNEASYCNERIRALDLPMKLTSVEHLFGGDKIIFYFLADGRVDFRALVKDLAKQYRTRIEMRQIGVRDESRLLGDYEHCGRELCCRTFMQNLEPVMMRMAKLQKTTLDPSKISGHCGRLMCCLRFEDAVYADLKKQLPSKGTYIQTENLRGEVLDYDILKQTCLVEVDGGDRVTVHVDEILERRGKGRSSGKEDRRDSGNSSSCDSAFGKSCSGKQDEKTGSDAEDEKKGGRRPDGQKD